MLRHVRTSFLAGALAAVLVSGLAAVPAAAAETTTASTVTMVGEPGSSTSSTKTLLWRSGTTDSIEVTQLPDKVLEVHVSDGAFADEYRLRFAGAYDQDLGTSEYTGAKATAGRGSSPGLDVVRPGTNCPSSAGRFEILDLAPDLSRLWIVYEHHCEGANYPAAFGEIRYNMPADPDLLMSPSRIVWPFATTQAQRPTVPVTFVNTGSAAVTMGAAAIGGEDPFDFGIVNNTCGTLTPGTACTVVLEYYPRGVNSRDATLTVQTSTPGGARTVALRGYGLNYNSPGVIQSLGNPPGSVFGVSAAGALEAVTLRWTDPSSPDFAETVVRGNAGSTAPATMTEGFEAYRGRAGTALIENLEPGQSYAFSLFATDSERLVAPAVTIKLVGAVLTATADRTRLTYGDALVISGAVKDPAGQAVGFKDLMLLAHDPRTGEVLQAGEARTDGTGEYFFAINPGATYDYAVVFPGSGNFLGGVVGTAGTIPVAHSVYAKPVKKSGRLGTVFLVVAGVDPISPGQQVVLEQLVKGKWKKVATGKLAKNGVVKIKLKPKAKGKFSYRVSKAASARNTAGASKTFTLKVT